MKKITLWALLLTGIAGWAQTSFEASPNYAKLQDLTYDPAIPNKLYAATNGNHIVVSADNGASWNLFYSIPVNEFISDMKIAPGNTALSFATRDMIYILNLSSATITGSFPIPQSGVDGAGPSWLNSYDLYDGIGDTMVVDTGFSVGLANFGKTFYTKDGGNTWTEVYYTLEHDNVFINDVAISPNNSDKIFLARGNGDSDIDGGLWTSTNYGADWTETLEGITLDAIAFNPANANEMMIGASIGFGEHPENLFRSADNGTTWSIIPITFTDETLNNITKIVYNPGNVQQIIVLEENEIIRTNNGGTNWESIVYPVGIAMDYYYGINASFNPSNGNQVAITTDLYPQFFNNTDESLTQILAPFFNIIGTSVANYSGSAHLYYGGQGGRHHKDITTDVSSAYDVEDPNSFNPKRNYMFADPSVPGRVFTYASMGFFGGWVNMSTDYGATTTNILQAFADDMQELTVDPNNTNLIYVSMRSGEGGNMFKIDLTDMDNIVSTEIITPQVTEVGDGVITGIVIDAADSNVMYIAKRHIILKTLDGGLNWEAIGTGLDLPEADIIWDLQGNPLNASQLTIGTNVGIYTSMDSGQTWNAILPNIDVKRVEHSPLNDGVLVGTVFSTQYVQASIAYSIDNGANWSYVLPEDIHYVQSYGMDYDFEGTTINAYIATSDLGVIKYPIENLVLGTQNPVLDNPVGMYPNPASDVVKVFADNGASIQSVNIYALTGQKVMESQSENIHISSLSNGIYIVKVKTSKGTFSQRLIKK